MNRILVPCDFSEISENALDYAIELAKHFSSSLVLLHIDQIPVMNSEFGMPAYNIKDVIADSKDILQKKAEKLRLAQPLIPSIECFLETGNPVDIIDDYINTHAVDFVVIGINGHGSRFMKNVFGSTAVSVSKKVSIPTLIIPPGANYKKISNIAYACDYDAQIENNSTLVQVKEINKLLDSNLQILHVIPQNHELNTLESEVDNFVEHKLENSTHMTYIISENNVSEGLLFYVKNHDIDMIIIEPKKHSFLHNLFSQSITSEIAFFSPVPVLTVHG